MEIEVLAIELHEEPIELCKLLKIANLVGGGGEAKMVITEGYVYLNGEVEYQKRKKIYFDDIVQFNGEAIMPVLSEEPLPIAEPKAEQFKPESAKQQNSDPYTQTRSGANSVNPKAKNTSNKGSAKKSKGNAKSSPKNKNQTADQQPISSNSRTGRKSISF